MSLWKKIEKKLDPVGDKKLRITEEAIASGKLSSIHGQNYDNNEIVKH
ncbi:MAG: hypothetical protein ACYCSO_03310 [Cuniculiplasma sp.]